MTFLELGIIEKINSTLESFGITMPTHVQQKSIPYVLKKQDILCRSETGSGKTFAFALPIIQQIDISNSNIQAVILCPTRELAIQVADETKKIADSVGVRICAVFGGSTIERQVASLKKNPHIVVGTTGRFLDLIKRRALKIENADFVVLDEADEMLDMGFKPDIEKILAHTQKDRVTLMFSATVPEEVEEISNIYQNNRVYVEVGTANKAISTINQYYMFVDKKYKKNALLELFFSDAYGKSIVFTNTKQSADEISDFLNKNSIVCKSIHSDHRQNERRHVLDMFKTGKIDVLVATDVASRGLDIKNVKWIINYDLPHELEFYVHRIGRTARAGESGNVVNIITTLEQLSKLKDIEKLTNAKIKQFETYSVNLMEYFVDTKKLATGRNRFKKMNAEKKSQRYGSFEYLEDSDFEYSIKKSKNETKSKIQNKKQKNKNFMDIVLSKSKNSRNVKNRGFDKESRLYKSRDDVSKGKKQKPKQKQKTWYSKFIKK